MEFSDDVIVLSGDTVTISAGIVTHSGSIALNCTTFPSNCGRLTIGASATLVNDGSIEAHGILFPAFDSTLINRGVVSFDLNVIGGGGVTWSGRVLNEEGATLNVLRGTITTLDFINCQIDVPK